MVGFVFFVDLSVEINRFLLAGSIVEIELSFHIEISDELVGI